MGLLIYQATAKPSAGLNRPRMVLYLFAANAADLDFIPGLLSGEPDRCHHGISHSLGFAALVAVVCGLVLMFRAHQARWQPFVVCFALWSSHIGLDYFSIDNRLPYGVPLFWPLSDAYYIAPFAFFPGIRRALASAEFFTSLLSLHNLWAICVELLVLAPILILIWITQVATYRVPRD
jgi:inner membrane protein